MHNIKRTQSLDCSALKSFHILLQWAVPLYYSPLCGCDEVTKHFLAYWSLTCLIFWPCSTLTVCPNCDSKGEITALFKCFHNQFLYTKSISPMKSVFFNLYLENLSLFGTQFLHKFNQPQISQDDKGSS